MTVIGCIVATDPPSWKLISSTTENTIVCIHFFAVSWKFLMLGLLGKSFLLSCKHLTGCVVLIEKREKVINWREGSGEHSLSKEDKNANWYLHVITWITTCVLILWTHWLIGIKAWLAALKPSFVWTGLMSSALLIYRKAQSLGEGHMVFLIRQVYITLDQFHCVVSWGWPWN